MRGSNKECPIAFIKASDTNTVFDAMIGWDNEYNSYAIRLNSNKQPINFYSWYYERY